MVKKSDYKKLRNKGTTIGQVDCGLDENKQIVLACVKFPPIIVQEKGIYNDGLHRVLRASHTI